MNKPPDLVPDSKIDCQNCTQSIVRNGQKIYFDGNDFPVFEEFAAKGELNDQVIRYDSPDLKGYIGSDSSYPDKAFASNWLDSVKSQYGNNIVVKSNGQVEVGGLTYTWHHHQNGTTMFLVPSNIHNIIQHTGAGALIKYGLKGAFNDPIF
ncbi:MAG: HNH endonuclease [Saprospiraceae bacterium]